MKILLGGLAGAALIVAEALPLQAADTVRYMARPGSKVTISGTSTIHDWDVVGRIIGGSFEVEPAFQTDKSLKSVKSLLTKETNPKAQVVIPIRSLKSGNQKMDEIMQEAMRAKKNPMIRFKLKWMVLKGEVPAAGTPVKFEVNGDLSVSGVTKNVTLPVVMERLPDGKIKFKGQTKLKMTDFGITPPSPKIPGMSLIKTGDEVTIKYEWLLAPRRKA